MFDSSNQYVRLLACEYGSWSRWSDCMNGTKSRYRQVIKTYVNSNCHEQIQEAECQIGEILKKRSKRIS